MIWPLLHPKYGFNNAALMSLLRKETENSDKTLELSSWVTEKVIE